MNIDFSVLIIDDDIDYSELAKSQLEDFIKDNQLIPNIVTESKYDRIDCGNIGNKFDLVIVDYNLSNNSYGTSFIEKIRSFSLLPDIIFYSSTSSIDDIIENEQNNQRDPLINLLQKGVYFSNSENMPNVAEQVISKIIKRDEKINGFKGLVLSSVSEFESIVNSILFALVPIIPPDKKHDLTFYAHDQLKELVESREKNFTDFRESLNLEKLFDSKHRWLDHYRRTKMMNHILKELGYKAINFDEYSKNVLDLRNSLGHVTCEQRGGAEYYSFEYNNETVSLTPDYCSEKRKMLLEWKNLFKSILNELNEKQ